MEEFEEFDVLFSENPHHHENEKNNNNQKKKSGLVDSMKVYPELLNNKLSSSITKEEEEEEEENRRKKKKKMSVPIRIPLTSSGNSILNGMDQSAGDDDDCIFEEETWEEAGRKRLLIFVAPHLMVEQRWMTSKRMAFSVCTGNGRTLKGRDLSRVRNSVLKMTGFIETC